MKNTNKKSISMSGFCLILLTVLFGVSAARAATYTVSNTGDSGAGSLRQAILDANALAGDDTINFSLTGCPCTITLTSGALSIANNGSLTISGLGASQLSVSGNNQSGVFYIQPSATAFISGITITGGNGAYSGNDFGRGYGGGVFNDGTLTLANSIVSGNFTGYGGGILNNNTLTLTNSTVSGNTASQYGGGIFNYYGKTMTVANSTISGNTAGYGSGIFNGGTATLTNSTVSGNSAYYEGGGIYNARTLTLTDSTVSNNRADYNGGGIFNDGALTLTNSIIANSTSGGDCYNPVGTLNASYSLVEDGTCGVTNGVNNNLTGDPLLGPLQDNGGATFTHALLTGSIAIDAGNSTLSTDQRGLTRPVDNPAITNATDGDGADIGAFEVQQVVADADGDGVSDANDNCPDTANANQANNDDDALGDVCDSDDDNDGVFDTSDAFPFNPNESADTDGDGIGNNADTDDDNDGQSDADEIACGSNPLDAASKCAPPATGPPTTVEQCKNGGWMTFTVPRSFKNEKDCIKFVTKGK